MTGETEVMRAIRKALCLLGWCRVMRNSVGFDAVTSVRYGLGKGSPDLVGYVQLENGLARAFAIEVKRPVGGRVSPEQKAWIGAFNKAGGAAAVCRSVPEAIQFAKRARAGERFT